MKYLAVEEAALEGDRLSIVESVKDWIALN